MDKHGVIWTRYTGEPVKLATIVLTDLELRIAKTEEAIQRRIPGVSVIHDLAGIHQVNYSRRDSSRLPPQLLALIPPRDQENLQRRILERVLATQINTIGMPLLDKDWHMLILAGRNGIGHLDVFSDDDVARDFYQRPMVTDKLSKQGASLWHALRRVSEHRANEDDVSLIASSVGPTPGISGMVPKLMVPIAVEDGRWDGSLFSSAPVPAVVKVESYPGLVGLESLALAVHREAGLSVPRSWTAEIPHSNGMLRLLALERFDRTSDGLPIPVESLFSMLQTGNPKQIFKRTDGTMEMVAQAVGLAPLSKNPFDQKKDLFRRFVLSLLTGNGDLHTENLSILGPAGSAKLSPVYDPAPMRAYRGYPRNHDLFTALPFAGIGGSEPEKHNPYADRGETPPDLGGRLVQYGASIGLSGQFCRDAIAKLLLVTQDYEARASNVLSSVRYEERKPGMPDIDGFVATLKVVRGAIKDTFMPDVRLSGKERPSMKVLARKGKGAGT